MRIVWRSLVFLLLLTLTGTFPAFANAGDSKHVKVKVYGEGNAFCPRQVLALGRVAIQTGRCYLLAVLRDNRGAFLAFVDPAVRIPQGQLVRLDTPAGRKLRGRIFYLVPLQMTGQIIVAIPVNTVQLVQLREEDEEDADEDEDEHKERHILASTLVVILTSSPLPGLSITFVVRF